MLISISILITTIDSTFASNRNTEILWILHFWPFQNIIREKDMSTSFLTNVNLNFPNCWVVHAVLPNSQNTLKENDRSQSNPH